MKNRKNNVLPFPKPPEEEPGTTTIIARIGRERFAIYMRIEDLPPAAPAVTMLKRRAPNSTGRDREVVNQMKTKFLRLRTPVELGSLFGDWTVCWLGGCPH